MSIEKAVKFDFSEQGGVINLLKITCALLFWVTVCKFLHLQVVAACSYSNFICVVIVANNSSFEKSFPYFGVFFKCKGKFHHLLKLETNIHIDRCAMHNTAL